MVDLVYDKLRAAILSGDMAQGSRIVELQVARELGTSRAPVREAVNRLLQAGLVETRAHHGPSVITMTSEQAIKLYKLRSAVECAAIEEVASRPQPKLPDLSECIERMRKLARLPRGKGFRLFVEEDLRFHQALWAMSDNEYIRHVANLIGDQVQMALVVDDARSEDLAVIAENHVPIVDAIADGDVCRAVQVMREHLTFDRPDRL
ncbi:MAG: GntR family transcriptional regulator [Janthinobacterium lividum]